ncbi:MAG: hypothetical protein JSS81_00195 [Acidobacteria bacterium]|nr:hypothetical protein [Acidobacteriota bacterium]
MFKINAEQLRAFQPDADEAFVRRVTEYLLENHPDAEARLARNRFSVTALPVEKLREMIRGGLERAREHGIHWKSTLLAFVVLMFLAAPNFDEHLKAARFFRENETVDDERFENFVAEMSDDDWTAVEAAYDETGWRIGAEL